VRRQLSYIEGLVCYFVLGYLDFRVGVYIAKLGVYLGSVLICKQSLEIESKWPMRAEMFRSKG